MKKTSKIIVLALSLAVALSAFVFASSAEDAPFLVEGLYRETWADAIDNADAETPIELLNNYTVQDGEYVEITESVTIKLNGYTMKGAEDGMSLFAVSGKDAVLTIVGPGTIEVNGTLAEIYGDGAALVLDGEEEINVVSASDESAFVIGGDNKASASVLGKVNFVNKVGANLFEVKNSSSLVLDGSEIAVSADGANEASGVAIVKSGAKLHVLGGAVISNTAGYIVKVADTDVSLPVSVKFEEAVINSSSAIYGRVVETGSEYAYVTFRACELIASGAAFSADDTMGSYDGSGADKVYETPKASIVITNSTYTVPSVSTSDACLFYGNITGIFNGGMINFSSTSKLAIRTRLWDGENGILLKAGVKLSDSIESSYTESLVDEDGVIVYFDPANDANNNFSLEIIDGTACVIYQSDVIDAENNVVSQYIVGVPKNSFFLDTSYSTNFENSPLYNAEYQNSFGTGSKIFTNSAIASTHSSLSVLDSADGNRYLKLEYDASKSYNASSTSYPYFSLKLGYGALGTVPEKYQQYKQDFITVDFDITSETADKNGNAVYYDGTWYLMQRIHGSGWAWHETNQFSISKSGLMTCGKENLLGEKNTYQLPTTPGEWTHLTFVYEINNDKTVHPDGSVTYDKYISQSRIHFYVDGVYVGTDRIFNTSDFTDVDILALNPDEFRLSMTNSAGSASAGSRSLCFDNFVMSYYPDGYDGDFNKTKEDRTINLKDISDAVYKRGYVYPSMLGKEDEVEPFVANVDGIDFYDMDAALKAVAEGSVLELFADVEGTFNTNVTFTAITNGHKFDVHADGYVSSSYKDDNGNDVITLVKATSFVPVYWDINISYETKVPLGSIPEFTGALLPGYEENGRFIDLIGWSYKEGATTPDEVRPISKEDVDRGYIILYPVYGVTRVLVEFKGVDGESLGSEWFNVGDPVSSLNSFNDGSEFPTFVVNDWYYGLFSGWKLNETDADTISAEHYYAVPAFEKYFTSAIKQSFTLKNLTQFIPNLYVAIPTAYDNVEIVGMAVSAASSAKKLDSSTATINGIEYYKYDLEMAAADIFNYEDKTFYFIYKIDGVEFRQPISVEIGAYLENVLLNAAASDSEKTAVMDMIRMTSLYIKAAGKPANETLEKYLNDSEYNKYLSKLSDAYNKASNQTVKVGGETITYKEYYTSQTQGKEGFNGLFDHVSKVRWDFVKQHVNLYADTVVHPLITNGWNPASNPGVFCRGDVVGGVRINLPYDPTKQGIWRLELGSKTYGAIEYGSLTDFSLQFEGHLKDGAWDRTTVLTYKQGETLNGYTTKRIWNLNFHVIHINEALASGDTSVAAEAELSNAIYMAHASMRDALTQSGKYTETPLG